jgi:hypothetical protein
MCAIQLFSNFEFFIEELRRESKMRASLATLFFYFIFFSFLGLCILNVWTCAKHYVVAEAGCIFISA